MKVLRFILPMLLLTGFSASQALASMTQPRGLQKFGYPVVLASVQFTPGHALKVSVPDQVTGGQPPGYATFSIPAHAFNKPVTVRFLAATNSAWDGQVSSNLKVIANFAYLVTDNSNGAIVKKFNKPITYTLKDPMVTKDSIYWATTAHNPPKLINANKARKIKGETLTHPTPVSAVGWIITTPKSDLSMGGSKSGGNHKM